MPEGSLESKPTWWNASGRSTTSAFFVYVGIGRRDTVLKNTVHRPNSLLMQVEGVCLMRYYMTSFAILLALIAFSPTPTMAKGPGGGGGEGGGHANGARAGGGEQGGEHQAGVSAGEQGAEHQAKVSGDEQGGEHQVGVAAGKQGGNAGTNLGVRSKAGDAAVQGMKPHQVYDAHNRPEFAAGNGEGRDSWRYRWDNGRWWFWGADNRWMWYGDDGQWLDNSNAYVVQRPISEGFSGGPIKIINPAKNGATLNYTLDGNAFSLPPGYSQELREDRAREIQFSRGANLAPTRYGLQAGLYTFARTDGGLELYHSEFPKMAAPQPPKAAPTKPSAQ